MGEAARKRLLDETHGAEGRKRRKLLAKKAAKLGSRSLDSLQWKSVALPDRLDDYEGFYGLEEVDDVQVVRDAASSKVSFVAQSRPGTANNEGNRGTGMDRNHTLETSGQGEEMPIESTAAINDAPRGAGTVVRSQTRLPKHKQLSAKGGQKSLAADVVTNGAFSILAEEDGTQEADVAAWGPLGLAPDMLASLGKLGFARPTPIQQSCIPEIMAGGNIVGKASTGSGKTLAYGIPILEKFLQFQGMEARQRRPPIALVLAPTRELAHQISRHLQDLCGGLYSATPKIATITGGLSVQKQHRLIGDADVVVGTPGRLWEVIGSGHGTMVAIKQIRFLVIDEADRLLSDGRFQEVEEILNALDRVEEDSDATDTVKGQPRRFERQTLIFSATFDKDLQRKLTARSRAESNLMSNKDSLEYLSKKLNFRSEPKFVDVDPVRQLATGIKEGLIECPAGTDKDLYLYAILLLNATRRTLVFTNSVAAVRRITPFLQNLNQPALPLHSGMPQKARLRSIERFSDAANKGVLIATDVAARGLDIANVEVVVHYHLPRTADMYVHRSGRTARAGQAGSSILICAPEEVAGVRRLVAKVHAQAASRLGDGASDGTRQGFYIRTLDMNRKVVSRLKPRATLAKKLADTAMAQDKGRKEDDFLRKAAEELGVDYSSDEFEQQAKGKRGRGSGRAKKDKEARQMAKGEVAGLRAELKALLKERVNVGVSEKYITSGNVDVGGLLREMDGKGDGTKGDFLGSVDGLGLDV